MEAVKKEETEKARKQRGGGGGGEVLDHKSSFGHGLILATENYRGRNVKGWAKTRSQSSQGA